MLELQDCLGRIFTKEQLPTELLKIAQRLQSVFEKKENSFVLAATVKLIRKEIYYQLVHIIVENAFF